jgi:cell division protein FtsI (penicillin-binding protein 3)
VDREPRRAQARPAAGGREPHHIRGDRSLTAKVVNRRIRLLLLTLLVAFGAVFVRAFWLQGVRAAPLAKLALAQHRDTQILPASRGTLFDRTGFQLALGEQATTVYADPRQIVDARAAALAAQEVFGRRLVQANRLYPLLADRRKAFVYVCRKCDPAKAAVLAGKHVTGLYSYREERRSYPQDSVAAQVLGYAGVDNHGLAGLELQLDKTLSGKPGSQTIIKDPFGRAIDVISATPVREGRNVTLTIDHTIQAQAETVLRRTMSHWGAKDATAIVLDPRSGEILAMAVEPGYDANKFGATSPQKQRNRAVTDYYEPGSTFKVVTVAGALSSHLVTPQTAFTLPYSLRVADRIVHDAEKRGTVRYTVSQILSRSSNIGAITLAEMLGKERLAEWIGRFGFGKPTGIDFPGETAGAVLPADRWSGSTIGNVPIGQGVAVTPMQMASAYAAIANKGVWVQPHLVQGDGGKRRRVLSAGVAAQLVQMLKGVTIEGGTAPLAAIPGYQVAGKTGTAQKPEHGSYAAGKYVASFVGMVPASNPRLVVLVAVDEPRGAIWGGVVAAPAFQEIAQFDLQYLEVPPDGPIVRN